VQIERGRKLANVLAEIRSSNSRRSSTAKESATALLEAPRDLESALQYQREAQRLKEEIFAARQAAADSKQAHLEKCWHRAVAKDVCVNAVQLEKVLDETCDTAVPCRQAEKLFKILSADGNMLHLKDFTNLFPSLSKQLEDIQAREQLEQTMASKLKMKKLWERRQREREIEQQAKWLESQPFLPQLPLQPTLKAFCLGAYILPLLDMVLLWTWPAANIIVYALTVFLFVCTVFATIEKTLPKVLRFHLNQSVLLDSLLKVVKLALTAFLITKDVFPDALVVAFLIGKIVVAFSVICICLSLAEYVRKLPAASADSVQRSEIEGVSWLDADFFDCLPSPSWFPWLGIIASSIVFVDYFMVVMTILENNIFEVGI